MIARRWMENCADDEWGNEIMRQIAIERFAKDPSIDIVEVREHAGWHLSFNRNMDVVGTANDMAQLSPAVAEWRKQFDKCELVGWTQRGKQGDQFFDSYYPKLAKVVA